MFFAAVLQQSMQLTTALSYTEIKEGIVTTDKSLHISLNHIFLPFDLFSLSLRLSPSHFLAAQRLMES